MARKTRECLPDTHNHAISRCIERKPLMRRSSMKDLMHDVLNEALEKYHFELVSYSIMDNHFHFNIKTLIGGETISRIMQFIKSQFARRYNKMMDRIGPFWNERFVNMIIERTANPVHYFWNVFLYTAYNPVRSKYVSDPRKYAYGGFRAYVDREYIPPVAITFSRYFQDLGNNYEDRLKKLLEYEDMYRKRIFPREIFEK
ncbi:MAG: transposase [Spirochaetes bacterium]|nr:transposase [Spirochaetota bacterium]